MHESIYGQFVKKAVELAKKRTLGDPKSRDTLQGPIIDENQTKKVLELVESGKKEGAVLEIGGERVGKTGFYVAPTVFSNVTDNMRIARSVKQANFQMNILYICFGQRGDLWTRPTNPQI